MSPQVRAATCLGRADPGKNDGQSGNVGALTFPAFYAVDSGGP